ncbi:hypothetical protein J1614_003285 [Plenodomus biglobosus]|nr:hypothetical protein J1614_003285 [Plenodomus biglobosus]
MALPYTLLTLMLSATSATAQNNYYYEPSTSSYTPAFWTATTRLIDVYSELPYTYYNGEITTESFLSTRTIKNGVTPTVAATFTTTSSQYYSDVEEVYLYYPTGAVAESDLVPESRPVYGLSATASLTTTTTVYEYYMPVTMTAPSSCPTIFTVTSVASVDIPRAARALVTATSTATGATVSDRYGDTTVSETWYLPGGAAPYPTTDDYNYSEYIESCYTPPLPYKTASPTPSSTTGGGLYNNPNDSSSSRNSDNPGELYCYWAPTGCLLPIKTIIIIVCSIVGGLFILGFLESWFWFRRLMHGRSAMRFGTVCWVLMLLLVLCATRIQDRRTEEDRILLAEKWKEMTAGAKFKAWMRYGFRHRYPEEHLGQFSRMTVGIVPPGEPLHPAMEQPPPGFLPNSQVFYYGPQTNGQPVPLQGYMVPPGQHAGYYGGEMPKQGIVVDTAPLYPRPPQPVRAAPRGATNMTASSSPPERPGSAAPPEVALPPLPPRPINTASSSKPMEANVATPAPASAPSPPPVVTPGTPSTEAVQQNTQTSPRQEAPQDIATEGTRNATTPQDPQAIVAQDVPLSTATQDIPPSTATQDATQPSATQSAPQLPPIDSSELSVSNAPSNPEQPSGLLPKHDPDNKSLYEKP